PAGEAAVEVTHLGLMNMLNGVQMRIGLNSDDTVIALGAAAAESHPIELLLPLLHGARIAMASPEETADPQPLAQLCRRARVRVVQAAPELWPALLAALPRRGRLAKALFKGGSLDPALAAHLLARGAELWSLQSYAESSGCVAARPVR